MKFIVALLLAVSFTAFADPSFTLEQIEEQLKTSGLEGEVHGSSGPTQLFVLTVRAPGNFFEHKEFPLTSTLESVREQFKTLNRHDKVKVKGNFVKNEAPIKHIQVDELAVVKKYESSMPASSYKYQAKMPDELLNKTELSGKVHAVADGGKILVLEYKDVVLPVFVRDEKWTKDLFRNDIVTIKYLIRKKPQEPVHIMLDPKAEVPLVVNDKMVSWHGKPGSVEGYLVLFPKSPQVVFNVFALQVPQANGATREYTLVNFDDPKVFEHIREKLQELWDKNPGKIENARNKFINLNVKLKATGTFNVVDPGQANPQILLTGPESLTVITK